jgi:hypothetical protein
VRRVLALFGLLLAATPVSAQISPGKLARAHRELEGSLRCTKCHAGGRDALRANCLACHGDVAWLIQRRRGFHAAPGRGDCASCHPDHAGEDFALIVWPGGSEAGFDHRQAGWPLAGRHARIRCAECHAVKFRVSPAAAQFERRAGAGWTGLETRCTACHEDPHRGALAARCETCHDVERWSSTPGFDHARTRYPLTGRHRDVACDACHATPRLSLRKDARGRTVPQYRPLPFGECSACHADPHAGRLGTGCARCHLTTGFGTPNARGFDHDRTPYPLRGAHVQTACDRCHDFSGRPGARRSPPAFAACTDCHRDPHAGTATLAGKVVACDACHDLRAFTPATFTVARHATTRYPLEGAHARARCEACHGRQGTTVVMRPAAVRCIDCHRDPHGGPPGRDCAPCHDVQAMRPSTVDVAAHARFAFVLEGAHRAVPCAGCHATMSSARRGGTATISFTASRTCVGCHTTPHGTQFNARPDRGACAACHDAGAWRPAARFDHERDAAFSLAGGHARVPCASCHPSGGRGVDRVYRPVSAKCESCHKGTP